MYLEGWWRCWPACRTFCWGVTPRRRSGPPRWKSSWSWAAGWLRWLCTPSDRSAVVRSPRWLRRVHTAPAGPAGGRRIACSLCCRWDPLCRLSHSERPTPEWVWTVWGCRPDLEVERVGLCANKYTNEMCNAWLKQKVLKCSEPPPKK